MNISGVLVHAYPVNADRVCAKLEKFTGVEVHGSNNLGKIVVTVESNSAAGVSDTLVDFQNIPGVLSASMIYHQFEE